MFVGILDRKLLRLSLMGCCDLCRSLDELANYVSLLESRRPHGPPMPSSDSKSADSTSAFSRDVPSAVDREAMSSAGGATPIMDRPSGETDGLLLETAVPHSEPPSKTNSKKVAHTNCHRG